MKIFYNNSKNFRTKPLFTFLFCILLIIIPGVILWLFFGYINFSENFLIFPAYGHIASGTKQEVIDQLNHIYSLKNVYWPIRDASYQMISIIEKKTINNKMYLSLYNFSTSYVSPIICAVIFPYLFWSIITPFIFKFFKLVNFDVVSFSFTCAGLISIIILTGAIPVGKWNSSGPVDISSYIILARIVISAVSIPFFFFISNKLVMLFLNISKDQQDYYMQVAQETLGVQKKETEMREKRRIQKLKNKEPNYVEIESKQINLKNKKEDNKN